MKMEEDIFKLTIGGLLHDVGKMVYRTGKGKYHGDLGADFLSDELKVNDEIILNQVRLHHVSRLKNANIEDNDLTYITYLADNISAGVDRRMHEEGIEPEPKGYRPPYGRHLALQSVFNVLKDNVNLGSKNDIGKNIAKEYIMTKSITEENMQNLTEYEGYTYEHYKEIQNSMVKDLQIIKWNADYVNSIISILENYYSYIPSSTYSKEIADISLYDHSKLTAAFGCCIYEYLKEKRKEDYKELFLKRAKEFYSEEAFLYYTFDVSGIQDFIYTIHSDGALKNLRARSFYLEILVEHIADELLERLGLSRVNLLYTGGGHAQFVLPNTEETRRTIEDLTKDVNQWLQRKFDIKLFYCGAYCICCAKDFMVDGSIQFQKKMTNMQEQIQKRKMNRYTAEELEKLNGNQVENDRECKVCRHSGKVNDNGECSICECFRRISRDIMNPESCNKDLQRNDRELYVITKSVNEIVDATEKQKKYCLPLPFDCNLYFVNTETFQTIKENINYVRVYCKNKIILGCRMETHLWVGDYNRCNTLEETADTAIGIRRIGVLRADVDNLGNAFIKGFDDKHNTLSRRTMFSGRMSLFFKYYINSMLKNGKTFLREKEERKRNITVVYSGGDDVFLVGSWDDILGFAIDLYDSFQKYTQNKLSLSIGIGIYPEKYPVSQSAYQVGMLEEYAKMNGKDSVTLFDAKYTFKWEKFVKSIYEEKYKTIYNFFTITDVRGISFLYHLLELLEKSIEDKSEEKISLARYAFLLAKLEPNKNEGVEKQQAYYEFARLMYQWIQKDEDTKETIVAIYLYLYVVREDNENDVSKQESI